MIKASFTSTSTSKESISTIEQIPVLVKPPPADTGDTISPGCAALKTTTPPKGARIFISETNCFLTLKRASKASMLALAASNDAWLANCPSINSLVLSNILFASLN